MAIPRSGGGGGVNAEYLPLLDFLRGKLRGYFFKREGMPTEDVAYINLIRLRALFENTGDESLLREYGGVDEGQLTVHEAAGRVGSDRISGTVNALFGRPGHININLGGNTMPNGTDARTAVGGQWTDMQRIGSPDEVLSQPADDGGPSGPLPGPGDRDPRPSPGRDILPPPGAGDRDPRPSASSESHDHSGDDGVTDDGGDTWSDPPADETLPEAGTARQIPGGEELWHVDGKVYLAYRNPRHPNLWLTWHVENPDRLNAIYGDDVPAFDKELTQQQYEALSPWEKGLSSELRNTSEDPWTQHNSDYQKAAERRPWLNDPSMIATIAGAYLEGRDPTQDELSETDWWNDHTAEERAFMENAVTAGKAQLREDLREEARTWLGPEFGNMSADQIDRWVDRVHDDPGQADDFVRLMKKQRKALFPNYEDEELTYEDIVTPFRNLASNVWGQPFDDESMLVDLANTQDYTVAAERLRKTGRKRGVEKVINDMFGALGQTEVGQRVVRSAI